MNATITAADARCRVPAPSPTGQITFTHRMTTRHAGERDVTVHAEWQGRPDGPVVIVAGGISAGRHAAASTRNPAPGWWDAQIGAGKPIDPDRRLVLAIDWIGADGAVDHPVDAADQADALAATLDRLNLDRVAAFVGASYGAMTGLQFAARHGRRLDQLVAISGAHRPHPYASALRGVQRGMVTAAGADPRARRQALALARQLAMLTYRTPAEFAARFAAGPTLTDDGAVLPASAGYLARCGERYAASTAPAAFLCLSASIDLHLVDPAAIAVPVSLVAVEEDQIVPPALVAELASQLGGPAQLTTISSLTGHDAFLTEPTLIGDALRAVLNGGNE
ncbi:homoserine O-succinyltransferase MetX [Pilimelia columellifera]|uniref:Homoserine O-succinyltransferase n=1 Tax=Pilimelia columellifera subsp. columellifera TaxID=706583 RepID=A0ABP6ANE0_9ACTN